MTSSSNQQMPTLIVLDECDVDRLLRRIYKGKRPSRVHTLICGCGKVADTREGGDEAWVGWQLLPIARCPECLAKAQAQLVQQVAELYPTIAYERFLLLLENVLLEKARAR